MSPAPGVEVPRAIHLRRWPGRATWRALGPMGQVASLRDRAGLVLHACAHTADPSRLGLLGAIETAGVSVVCRILVVSDGLPSEDPAAFAAIASWAEDDVPPTTRGRGPGR